MEKNHFTILKAVFYLGGSGVASALGASLGFVSELVATGVSVACAGGLTSFAEGTGLSSLGSSLVGVSGDGWPEAEGSTAIRPELETPSATGGGCTDSFSLCMMDITSVATCIRL